MILLFTTKDSKYILIFFFFTSAFLKQNIANNGQLITKCEEKKLKPKLIDLIFQNKIKINWILGLKQRLVQQMG